jgi:hypothetical protein
MRDQLNIATCPGSNTPSPICSHLHRLGNGPSEGGHRSVPTTQCMIWAQEFGCVQNNRRIVMLIQHSEFRFVSPLVIRTGARGWMILPEAATRRVAASPSTLLANRTHGALLAAHGRTWLRPRMSNERPDRTLCRGCVLTVVKAAEAGSVHRAGPPRELRIITRLGSLFLGMPRATHQQRLYRRYYCHTRKAAALGD